MNETDMDRLKARFKARRLQAEVRQPIQKKEEPTLTDLPLDLQNVISCLSALLPDIYRKDVLISRLVEDVRDVLPGGFWNQKSS